MTMEIPKQYEPAATQGRIYRRWLEKGCFAARPDERRERYVIMMPLPNVTGALHMGHAMDNVMQDLLIRWHRMRGDNTLWMPGIDHAGIATQAIVEKFLFETEGKTRNEIGREALVERIWAWKGEQEKQIISQQQQMGCSCDWDRHRFTLDPVCVAAVREAFFRLFRDGLIYRGDRLVNWDVHLQTAVSDDEVYKETVQGHFWHLEYPVVDPRPGEPEKVAVATTRPETMLGDTAVACHPDPRGELERQLEEARTAGDREEVERLEERIRDHLPLLQTLTEMAADGRTVMLPLAEREIPLILDEWAKPELGSGCVKITPAHDPNDYEVWQRHRDRIGIVNILESDGTLNASAGAYRGLDVPAARAAVVAALTERGLLARVEEREMEVSHSDRSKTPIEPYLSRQWFVRMGDVEGGVVLGRGTGREFAAPGLAQAALDAVDPRWRSASGRNLSFYPDAESYGAIYRNWLEEKRDWCISRQLWWGHQIPIWHGSLSPERLADLLDGMPAPEEGLAWVWVGDADGRQLPPRDALAAADADEELEVQVCLRAGDAEEELAQRLLGHGLERDPDVLDTWFSSALWPHSTLGWPDPEILGDAARGPTGEDLLSYYYPGSCLVTGRDIITLWVVRMIIMGLYNLGDVPFTDCFVHATILDGKGETMSKSKGNGIDPSAIIDRYGADAMRYQICNLQTGAHYARLPVQAVCPSYDPGTHPEELIDLGEAEHGKTLHGDDNLFTYLCPHCGIEFDVSGTLARLPRATIVSDRFEVGRRFCTKLYSATRFALLNLDGYRFRPLGRADLAAEDVWILSRLSCAIDEVTAQLAAYNPSAALSAARGFFWDELCDWYLEMIKPRVRDEGASSVALQVVSTVLDQVLRLLHPFLPFVTEELWSRLAERAPQRGIRQPLATTEMLIEAPWPGGEPEWRDVEVEREFELLHLAIRAVRDLRAQHGAPARKPLEAAVRAPEQVASRLRRHREHLLAQAALAAVEIGPDVEPPAASTARVEGEMEIYLSGLVDRAAEAERLTAQLGELEERAAATRARLANEQFVTRAPAAVVEGERTKLAQLTDEIDRVTRRLSDLRG